MGMHALLCSGLRVLLPAACCVPTLLLHPLLSICSRADFSCITTDPGNHLAIRLFGEQATDKLLKMVRQSSGLLHSWTSLTPRPVACSTTSL